MIKFFKLVYNYFSDKRKSFLYFYKSGKGRIIGFWLISGSLIFLFLFATIKSFIRRDFSDVSNIYGLIKAWIVCLFGIYFFYFILLACHLIVTEDYIEYVEYFVKRRKIKFNELNNIGIIYKYGAPTLIIESIQSDIIEINLSFFKDKDYIELMSYIGNLRNDLEPICEKLKVYAKPKIRNRTKKNKRDRHKVKVSNNKKREESIQNWVSIVISITLCINVFFAICVVVGLVSRIESLSWLSKFFKISSRFITIIVLISGYKLAPRVREKLKKKSLKYTVIIGILFVVIIPLALFISIMLYLNV